jgi:hypothetical protein
VWLSQLMAVQLRASRHINTPAVGGRNEPTRQVLFERLVERPLARLADGARDRIIRFGLMGLTIDQPSSGIPSECQTNTTLRFHGAIRSASFKPRSSIERLPTRKELARAALGIIFSTAIITTLLGWWFLAR